MLDDFHRGGPQAKKGRLVWCMTISLWPREIDAMKVPGAWRASRLMWTFPLNGMMTRKSSVSPGS